MPGVIFHVVYDMGILVKWVGVGIETFYADDRVVATESSARDLNE